MCMSMIAADSRRLVSTVETRPLPSRTAVAACVVTDVPAPASTVSDRCSPLYSRRISTLHH